jgi:hypothetical protein
MTPSRFIEWTATGKPASAAFVKRWRDRNGCFWATRKVASGRTATINDQAARGQQWSLK